MGVTAPELKGARWYSPDLGRFLSTDPIQDGKNWYAFAGNDPVNFADPTGLFQHGHPLAGGFSGGTLSAPRIPTGTLSAGLLSGGPRTNVTVAGSGVLGSFGGWTNYATAAPNRLITGANASFATTAVSTATRPLTNHSALASFSTSTSVTPRASDFNAWSLPGAGSSSAPAARSLPERPYDGSINVDARQGSAMFDDPLVAAYRNPRAAVEIVASVLNEPIDYLLTAREIYNGPRNTWSYAGLIPGVPAAAGRVLKGAGEVAADAAQLARDIAIVKAGRAADKAASSASRKLPSQGIYEFPDATVGGTPYVGQSANIPRRLQQHQQTGRLTESTVPRITAVSGGRTAREIAEHQRVQDLTGGVPARHSSNVANQRDPIGPNRKYLLDD